jgi:SAM-dependent methyltransferase
VDQPEISDLIVRFDATTGERLPVHKSAVLEQLRTLGSERAMRIVTRIPARDDVFENEAVDALLLRAHVEMQRLSEEFFHGSRVRDFLTDVIAAFRRAGTTGPFRVVDLGCGTGFVLRWIAAHGGLGDDVSLIGADFNRPLIEAATRFAAQESLNVRFVAADALTLREPASVVISTGVLHHIPVAHLEAFFAGHERAGTLAFAHWDFQPSPIVPFGSWLFHISRFREPLARHDGIRSALRAREANVYLEAMRASLPKFALGVYNPRLGALPIKRVFHALAGMRPEYLESYRRVSKHRANWWKPWR